MTTTRATGYRADDQAARQGMRAVARATVIRDGRELYAVLPDSPAAPGEAVEVTAIPYFRWANRAPGAMRVWIPTT